VISLAMANVAARGEWNTIQIYNAGFPGGSADPLVITDQSLCHRKVPKDPTGTLRQVIESGRLRWCIEADDLFDPSQGGIGIATTSNAIEGTNPGDYIGWHVDAIMAFTQEAALQLGTPLAPTFVIIQITSAGFFNDLVAALRERRCDVTFPEYNRHPYREALVDFTCAIDYADTLTLITSKSLITASVEQYLASNGAQVGQSPQLTICTYPATSQNLAAVTFFPDAIQDTSPSSSQDVYTMFCNGQCNSLVDYTSSVAAELAGVPTTISAACAANANTAVIPRNLTPGGDTGGFTLRNGAHNLVVVGNGK